MTALLSFRNYFVSQLEGWVLSILFFVSKKHPGEKQGVFVQCLLSLQNLPCSFCSTNEQSQVALPQQRIRKLPADSEDLCTLYGSNDTSWSALEVVRKMIISPCSFRDFWPLLCFSFYFAFLPITTRNPTDWKIVSTGCRLLQRLLTSQNIYIINVFMFTGGVDCKKI